MRFDDSRDDSRDDDGDLCDDSSDSQRFGAGAKGGGSFCGLFLWRAKGGAGFERFRAITKR